MVTKGIKLLGIFIAMMVLGYLLIFTGKALIYYIDGGKPIVKRICIHGREYVSYTDFTGIRGMSPILENVDGHLQQKMCSSKDVVLGFYE